jgi:hypothetical protein
LSATRGAGREQPVSHDSIMQKRQALSTPTRGCQQSVGMSTLASRAA